MKNLITLVKILLTTEKIKSFLTLFEPGYIYYIFELGTAKLLTLTLKILKIAYISMKVDQNEVINMKF